MTDRLSLGLLQVNHDKSPIGDTFPDDSHRFRDLFDALDTRFRYRVYMTIGGELPASPSEQDAFLITGSPLSVLDDLAFMPALEDFIRACDAARKPLLGVCFGHQAIAKALGGTVARQDWNIGVEEFTFDPLPFMDSPATLNMHTFHHDAVVALPKGARRVCVSPGCRNAGFAVADHIFTTQAHPEFTDPFMRCVLDHTKQDLSEEEIEAAENTLEKQTDGHRFAEWATRFFRMTA